MRMIYFFGEIPLLQKQFYYFTRHSKTRLGCAVEPLIGESSWCRMRPKPRIEILLLRHRIPLTVMRLLFLFPFAVPPQRKGQRHEHPQKLRRNSTMTTESPESKCMVCVNRWTLTFPQNIRKKEYSIQFSQTRIDTNICSNYNGITAYKTACIQIANFP